MAFGILTIYIDGLEACMEPSIVRVPLHMLLYLTRLACANGQKMLHTVGRRGRGHHRIQKLSPQRLREHPIWPLPAVSSRLLGASAFKNKQKIRVVKAHRLPVGPR